MFDIVHFLQVVIFLNKNHYISMELHSLSNMAMRYMDNNSHKKLVDSITGTNGWILAFLDQNKDRDVFQKDLEESFGITRSTVSKVVNLMVQKGFIERTDVDYDARLKKLSLTEKAKELIDYMHEDHEKMENVLTSGFSDDEKELIYTYIERMKNNLYGAFGDSADCECFPIIKGGKR